MHRRLWRIALLVLLLELAATTNFSLWAQTINGIVDGTVRDPKGSPLPDVAITVANSATLRNYQASTNEQGYYRISEVPSGDYEVKAELSGFQVEQAAVRVDVNRVTTQNFRLTFPPKKEVVEVSSTAGMADTTGPTISTIFTDRQVRELPVLTRDVNNLALLAPGVSSVRTFSFASTLVPFAVNGSRGRDNNFIIDSVDNNEPLFGGAATQFTNTDIFAEYAVLTDQLKAEFGRASGATINAITKSGSKSLHGTLFGFAQTDNFNARNRVEKQASLEHPAQLYEDQLGATLGGPLKKEKAQYFISYQWDRARQDLSSVFPVVSTLPTAAGLSTLRGLPQTPALQALLSSSTVSAIPLVSAPCFASAPPNEPKASITNPCFPSTAMRLAQDPMAPVEKTADYGTFLVPRGNVFDVRDHEASGRLDYTISNTDDFYGRYLFDDLLTPRAVLAPAGEVAFSDLGLLPEDRNILRQRTQSLLLNERHQWVSAVNELRFSISRISQGIGAFNLPEAVREGRAAVTVGDDFGGFGNLSGNFPAAGNRFTVGRDSRPTLTHSTIFQWQENLSVTRGPHSFKFGADFVRTQSNIRSVPSELGQYFFGVSGGVSNRGHGLDLFLSEPGAGTGPTHAEAVFQRFPNVITDASGRIVGQGPETLPLREFDQFYFLQDDYRIQPNFTLNLGLRYERYGQPLNSIRALNPKGPAVSPDRKDIAPRFGFAWSPGNRRNTVIRGGYAIMYNPVVLNIPLLIWQSGPISPFVSTDVNGLSQTVRPSGVFPNAPLTLADIDQRVSGCSSFNRQAASGSIPLINCSRQDTVDGKLVNPYVQTFSLGVQHELTHNLLLEVGWVGSKGTRLFQRVDRNPFGGYAFFNPNTSTQLDSSCANFSALTMQSPICLRSRLDDSRGDITVVTNGGLSTYHALQASLTKRIGSKAGHFAFTAAYTWSHMLDNTSEIFGPGVRFVPASDPHNALFLPQSFESVEAITPLPQNSTNLHAEKGSSSFDRRHRLAISYLWELPSPGNRAPRFFFGGWQINGITAIQSGQPFTPLNSTPFGACADANGDGKLTNDRPNIGNPNAPENTVALLGDPLCINPSLGYVNLDGKSIDPSAARFVQVPRGSAAGNAGRNILRGPGLVNFDLSLYKNFRWGESRAIQFRWEIYDLLNTPNSGFPLGNVFATEAEPSPAFAFSPLTTLARVTGVIPENAIDAKSDSFGRGAFLSRAFMNTSSRRMQFGIKFIF